LAKAIKVAVLAVFSVPIAVLGTVLTSLVFLPLPVNLPRERAGVQSRISHVFDAAGNEIAIFREFDQNIPVKPSDIPTSLKQAVISDEDRSFYKHSGIDIRGSMRALWVDLRGGAVKQGGSTITQQYVKNVYVGNERTLSRKLKEAILANRVDRKLSKDEILFRYLNTIYLGEGAYGVGAASETYFRKPISQLTLSESALLSGIIPAPSLYQPRGNPEGADARRLHVLKVMLGEGYINQQQHDEAAAQVVWPTTRGEPPGPATLIHPPVKEYRKYPYFIDYVEKYLRARGYDPDRAGLRIQTSLDPAVQADAEKAVNEALAGTAAPLEMALASVEPPTGFVKALVGGRDFYNGPAANVNLALGGCPKKPAEGVRVSVEATCWSDSTSEISGGAPGRQTGSSWKPFTLAAALETGMSPNKVYAAPGTYKIPGCTPKPGDPCAIGNNEGRGGGSQTVRVATAQSTNTVYAQRARDIGSEKIADMAKRLGVGGAWYSPDRHGLSYTLGVLDTAPLDMASAYAVFANRGQRNPTTPIVTVRDSSGKLLIDNRERKAERVVDEIVADNVTALLRGVIEGGTGTGANIGRPAAGKTGSSQFNANAWFVGYTPTLSTAIWMGKTDGQGPNQALLRIKGVPRVFGGTIPARTWKAFMTDALKNVPVTDFNEPAPISSIADRLRNAERKGFDPGPRRDVRDVTSGEKYEFDVAPPVATEPTTTTTSTTLPDEEDPDDGGGGGPIPFP
ncbi:MAG: transglycosylase domain-containing protein, partial [Acidimicrobiales bacterium]|nr:transglycosylase domain-containing protein [Acidimicrobiales bacterium]